MTLLRSLNIKTCLTFNEPIEKRRKPMACELRGEFKKTKLLLAVLVTLSVTGIAGCTSSSHNSETFHTTTDLMDEDADGVINERDSCSMTVTGAKVDNEGCVELIYAEAKDELHILFELNSYKIPADFMDEVDSLARFLSDFPEANVLLKGYSSQNGPAKYNEKLSIQRANSVKNALTAEGIDPERVQIKGYGELEPVNASSPKQTEILSRRVTASVAAAEESVLIQWTVYSKAQKENNM